MLVPDYRGDILSLFQTLTPYLETRDGRRLLFVYSFNEWYERSSLEPAVRGHDRHGFRRDHKGRMLRAVREGKRSD